MESINNFFSQIDGRIFDYNFSNLVNSDYLFNNKPDSFMFQSWAFVICILGILITVLVLLFLKKRRSILYIEKGRRHILSFHNKINLVLISVNFVLVFLRSQGTQFLSMRFLLVLFFGFIFINTIVSIIRMIAHKPADEIANEIKTDDTYQKYLPKKKKKK